MEKIPLVKWVICLRPLENLTLMPWTFTRGKVLCRRQDTPWCSINRAERLIAHLNNHLNWPEMTCPSLSTVSRKLPRFLPQNAQRPTKMSLRRLRAVICLSLFWNDTMNRKEILNWWYKSARTNSFAKQVNPSKIASRLPRTTSWCISKRL